MPERATAAILRAGREQKGRRMCQGRHSSGGQGAEKPQTVPGPPSSGQAGNRKAAERAGTAILRAGREQKSRRPCQGHHSSGGQGAERPQTVPGPPSSGWAGSRKAAGRVRAAILRAGRDQKGRRTCQGHHPLGGQGAERPQTVPGPPFFGWAGNRTAAECARTAILRAGRERKSRRTCRDRHSLGG